MAVTESRLDLHVAESKSAAAVMKKHQDRKQMMYSLKRLLSNDDFKELFWNKDVVQLEVLAACVLSFDMMTVGSGI